MVTFINRMIGAALFNTRIYEEVEADRDATGQALAVVLLASVGTGIGWVGVGSRQVWTMVVLSAVAVAAWIAWALLTCLIGTRLLPEAQTKADPGELLRTLGFAQAPGVLRALGVVGGVGPAVAGLTALWTLATMVVAVRQALDFTSTGHAVAVCVASGLLALAMFWVIGVFFATPVS